MTPEQKARVSIDALLQQAGWHVCNVSDANIHTTTAGVASLDIFWLKDDSLADSDNLPAPGIIAQEIVEDLQAALEPFKLIAADLGADVAEVAA